MKNLIRILTLLVAIGPAALPQTPDVVQIERRGDSAILSVNTFRPLEAIAAKLKSQFGIAVFAEDPVFQFRGDLKRLPEPQGHASAFVPAPWGFEVRFPINKDGSPQNIRGLLASIVAEANLKSPFAYRLDEAAGAFFFVPTRTRNAQGRSIAMTPLLDRPVTIPPGIRPLNESAALMAADLSRQTGLQVSCCESVIDGDPWGIGAVMFAAKNEPARSVLMRLGLRAWRVSCDDKLCFIDRQ